MLNILHILTFMEECTNRHRDAAGGAVGGVASVVEGDVVAAGDGSRLIVALYASGQRVAHGGASSGVAPRNGDALHADVGWHHVVATPSGDGGFTVVVVGFAVALALMLPVLLLHVEMLVGGWLVVFFVGR
jgi:hypothetical protein